MKSIYLLGILVAVIPFLGFPGSWESVFFVIIGITIFIKSFNIYRLSKPKQFAGSSFEQNTVSVTKKKEAEEIQDGEW